MVHTAADGSEFHAAEAFGVSQSIWLLREHWDVLQGQALHWIADRASVRSKFAVRYA